MYMPLLRSGVHPGHALTWIATGTQSSCIVHQLMFQSLQMTPFTTMFEDVALKYVHLTGFDKILKPLNYKNLKIPINHQINPKFQ